VYRCLWELRADFPDNGLVHNLWLRYIYLQYTLTIFTGRVWISNSCMYIRCGKKTVTLCFVRLNLIKYWPIFKLVHCQNQENISNNSINKYSTTTQMCRYTTLWNVSVLKASIENETTCVTTHFKMHRTAARRTHWTFDLKLHDVTVTLDKTDTI